MLFDVRVGIPILGLFNIATQANVVELDTSFGLSGAV